MSVGENELLLRLHTCGRLLVKTVFVNPFKYRSPKNQVPAFSYMRCTKGQRRTEMLYVIMPLRSQACWRLKTKVVINDAKAMEAETRRFVLNNYQYQLREETYPNNVKNGSKSCQRQRSKAPRHLLLPVNVIQTKFACHACFNFIAKLHVTNSTCKPLWNSGRPTWQLNLPKAALTKTRAQKISSP